MGFSSHEPYLYSLYSWDTPVQVPELFPVIVWWLTAEIPGKATKSPWPRPPFLIGWFTHHCYFLSKGLSSSKRNHQNLQVLHVEFRNGNTPNKPLNSNLIQPNLDFNPLIGWLPVLHSLKTNITPEHRAKSQKEWGRSSKHQFLVVRCCICF